jgi:hypothetical protein
VPVGGTTGQVLAKASATDYDTEWTDAAGGGTVTSVGLTLDSGLYTVSGSPVTGSGTLTGTLATQSANTILAGPTTGGDAKPTFRALVVADIPDLSSTYAAASHTHTTSQISNLSSWTGSSSITTLGTIGTGTWQGTAVAVAYGGTGATDAATARTNLGAAPTASPTFTGRSTMPARVSTVATATDGATVTFDLAVSDWHEVTLGGNRTLALSNVATGQQFSIILRQDGTGSRTVTWFSGILWPGGTPPTLTTTANKRDVFTFKSLGGGVYLGFVAGANL